MTKIYIGCALTHAPTDFVEEIVSLKKDIRKLKDVSVIESYGLGEAKKCEIFERDIVEGVGQCDFMVAVCDFPSPGLGLEIAESLRLKKLTIAVAHEKSKVSDLVLDLDCRHPDHFSFCRYKNMRKDLLELIKAKIKDGKKIVKRIKV